MGEEGAGAFWEDGEEYWFAWELAPALECVEWRNFSKVFDHAMLASGASATESTSVTARILRCLRLSKAAEPSKAALQHTI